MYDYILDVYILKLSNYLKKVQLILKCLQALIMVKRYNYFRINTSERKSDMKKNLLFVVVSLFITLFFTNIVFAAELYESWTGNDLNCSELTGGNTGGSAYVDEEGGYRTLIHEVNTGVRPIKNFIAEDIQPDGSDIVLVYTVKVLSDDKTTKDNINVFGFYPLIYGDDELINNESEDALIFTAKDVRFFDYDSEGWAKVYYTAKESDFNFSDYDYIKVNNQVYYNGAKGSGCSIDIAVKAIEVYIGDPRNVASTPDKNTATPKEDVTQTPPKTTPTETKPEASSTPSQAIETPEETNDNQKDESSNPVVFIVIAVVAVTLLGCGAYLLIIKKKSN